MSSYVVLLKRCLGIPNGLSKCANLPPALIIIYYTVTKMHGTVNIPITIDKIKFFTRINSQDVGMARKGQKQVKAVTQWSIKHGPYTSMPFQW